MICNLLCTEQDTSDPHSIYIYFMSLCIHQIEMSSKTLSGNGGHLVQSYHGLWHPMSLYTSTKYDVIHVTANINNTLYKN